jgi:UDP-glucose 4-epimerase
MTERALVTGAGGFVCRHIVEAMTAAGIHVIAVDVAFDAELRKRWASLPVTFVQSDCSDLPDMTVDYVVHGVAITANPEQMGQSPIAHYQANVLPALAVLEWAARQISCRTIVISSSGVFWQRSDTALSESTPPQGTGTYVAAKRSMELLVETLRADYAQDLITIRLGSVYGPMEYARGTRPRVSRVMQFLSDALESAVIRPVTEGDQQDWTYAPDIGRAVVALLRAPDVPQDLYHVTSGEALSELDMAFAIQKVVPGVAVEKVEAPARRRRGAMSGARFASDIGFTQWTPFHEGIAQIVALAQSESERAL